MNMYLVFDQNDEVSYYYSNLNRENAKDILQHSSIGTFLLRDSCKDEGQIVLCVKESENRINNYKIIQKTNDVNMKKEFYFRGKHDFVFKDIPSLLDFYKTHYLIQSYLKQPVCKIFNILKFSK